MVCKLCMGVLKWYKQAIMVLEDVVKFLQNKGNMEEALSLGCTIDGICMCIETLQPFKPHWKVFLVDIKLLIIHALKIQTQ